MSPSHCKRLWFALLLLIFLLTAYPVRGVEYNEAAILLPASDWWLVIHNQCADTLHWINPSGEVASMPRPALPNEMPTAPCSFRAMHITQDGRFLVQTATLTSGASAVGFYDMQTGTWLNVYEAPANEVAHLGDRYSSDHSNEIAVSFTTQPAGIPGWRVVLFDISTGSERYELRADGSEIASFVGGEFLATTPTIPHVVLVTEDPSTSNEMVVIRFDGMTSADVPLGAVAWYPLGAPGVSQSLISSSYSASDIDMLPNGNAIQAYDVAGYSPGLPAGGTPPILSNGIGLLQPTTLSEFVPPALFYAENLTTVYDAHWGADGRIAMFRRFDGISDRVHWIKLGSAVLTPINQQIAQFIGVPNGFVYTTADGVYYVNEMSATPIGPVFTDPALSGSMAVVWATAFGNPAITLDMPRASAATIATPPVLIVTATPDTSGCRIRSMDGGPVNVRTGPGTDYTVVGQVSGSMELTVTGYNGEWYVVNFSGAQGWMSGRVSNLLGNCTGLSLITAPAPPTAPTAPLISGQPDLYVSEFSLDPVTPVEGQPVSVRVGVYNQGDASVSGATFHIAWYPGENYPAPACGWDLDQLAARGGRILTCTYAGYPSDYASINTKVVVDTGNAVAERDESNNTFIRAIRVSAS